MSEPLMGEIRLFAGNFEPRGWAFCHGQVLPIAQYAALFSVIGTTYGGNGRTTFALPDLRGRVALGAGQGPGLSLRRQGEMGGTEPIRQSQSPMPKAPAPIQDRGAPTELSLQLPGNDRPAIPPNTAATINTDHSPLTSQSEGHSRERAGAMPPYLVLNYIIALEGRYPS